MTNESPRSSRSGGALPSEERTEDLLDRLVADFSDRLARGERPAREAFLARAPAAARPGLERCFKTIEAGLVPAPGSPSALGPGVRLGRYELVRELGRGGMALVWLAHDGELRRPVALKLLRPGLALEERHVERFRREALAVARLRHPHVVAVFDVGELAGWQAIAMEYVEGPSLATVYEALADKPRRSAEELVQAGVPLRAGPDGRLPEGFEAALAGLFADVADALAAAHAAGLVHRDVKPSNLLVDRDGRLKVADFGLAKSDGDPALSLTGDTLGTPHYMSPEQAWLVETTVDHKSDVYSLGVTLFEGLSGRRPFEGRGLLEVFEAIRNSVVPGLRSVAPGASADAAAVVAVACAHDADQRYDDAAAFADDLRALAEGLPTRARRARGGPWRRFTLGLRQYATQPGFEYRSPRTFLGLPLVHVINGGGWRRGGKRLVAKGWFASGPIALGGVAMGGLAAGGLTMGGLAGGLLLGFGGASTGAVAIGGLALGGFAYGGLALGWLVCCGMGLGYGAIGGLVRGVYAMGGKAYGEHVWCPPLGRRDQEALDWFREHAGWLVERWSGIWGGG